MKKALMIAALVVPLTLTGCVISVDGEGDYSHHADWDDRESENRREISDLNTGINIAAVKRNMGTADFNELYKRGEDEYQVLFYRTHRTKGDGVTTKDECTPLVFKNGVLHGWGETAFADI
jgi:hypothetical protein